MKFFQNGGSWKSPICKFVAMERTSSQRLGRALVFTSDLIILQFTIKY